MSKIFYLAMIFFTLTSCVEEFQLPQKKDQPKAKQKTKLTNCTYWYLIASEQSNHTTNTSQDYVYTTCVDSNPSIDSPTGNEQYQNLYASNGITFPDNPAVNDTYEYTGPEGDYVKYNFSSDRTWKVMERIIPVLVVKTHPDTYAFLNVGSPAEGQVIYGLDDLYYTLKSEQWYGKKKQ